MGIGYQIYEIFCGLEMIRLEGIIRCDIRLRFLSICSTHQLAIIIAIYKNMYPVKYQSCQSKDDVLGGVAVVLSSVPHAEPVGQS